MEENELIKGDFYNIKNVLKTAKKIPAAGAIAGIYYVVCENDSDLLVIMLISLFLFGILHFIDFWLSKMEIVVSNKRVYGKAAFGRRVDLPLDSISSIGLSFFKGICIGTSSGRIRFLLIKNNKSIHEEISKLLLDRQKYKSIVVNDNMEKKYSNADELKKYKDLLDNGAITQEEYNQKKKELLNL